MGNTSFKCVAGALPKARVLLPDGDIISMDVSVDVSELMLQHPNHMVVHCSSMEQRRMGKRPTMTVMQPDQKLKSGEAYLVHPIPPQYKKSLFKSHPLLLSAREMSSSLNGHGVEHYAATEKQHKPRCERPFRLVHALFPKSISRSKVGRRSANSESQVSLSDPHAPEKEETAGMQISLYTGWRPALKSIPESPHGYQSVPELPLIISSSPMEI